jgi:hypothetical protein
MHTDVSANIKKEITDKMVGGSVKIKIGLLGLLHTACLPLFHFILFYFILFYFIYFISIFILCILMEFCMFGRTHAKYSSGQTLQMYV